jgi:hypothetical protein
MSHVLSANMSSIQTQISVGAVEDIWRPGLSFLARFHVFAGFLVGLVDGKLASGIGIPIIRMQGGLIRCRTYVVDPASSFVVQAQF